MSVIEDVRTALQDFLAPELRAVAAKFDAVDSKFAALTSKIDALESKMNTRFDAMDARFGAMDAKFGAMDSKFSALEASVNARLGAAEDKAASRQEILLIQFEAVKSLIDMDKRIQRLESQRSESLPKSA